MNIANYSEFRKRRKRMLRGIATAIVASGVALGIALGCYKHIEPSIVQEPVVAQGSEQQSKTLQHYVVCLDPGHGMSNRTAGVYDPGAVYNSFREADYVLGFAQELGLLLKNKTYEVVLTRSSEHEDCPLYSRGNNALESNSNIFISLHVNAAPGSSASGPRTFYSTEHDRELAIYIQGELVRKLEQIFGNIYPSSLETRVIREPDFVVLRTTQQIPSVLVELGFVTNSFDRQYLLTKRSELEEALLTAINKYFKS